MSRIRYTEEFKRDAVSQVVDRGYSVLEVSKRLGVTTKSLYDWVQRFSKPAQNQIEDAKLESENRRLKAELARVTEDRDILRKATAFLPMMKSTSFSEICKKLSG